MPTITAIEPQVGRRERVSLFLDGAFAMGVHAGVAAAAGWRVGQHVDDDALRTTARAEELRRTREAAVRLLGVRARSREELRRRLAQKGYEPDMVDEALAGLMQLGYVDDDAFAEAWVRHRTGGPQGMGRRRLAAELRCKGVDGEIVGNALAAVSDDAEYQQALLWARKRAAQLKDEEPRAQRRKLVAALARRGYGWETSNRVIASVTGDPDP